MSNFSLAIAAFFFLPGTNAFAQHYGEASQAQSSSGAVAHQQPLSDADTKFLAYAAKDNQAEIQLCILAEKKARAPSVKAFARLMLDDHVEIESRLASLINGIGVDAPNGVGREGKETIWKLKEKTGSDFDGSFMAAQVKDHDYDIEKFNAEIRSTGNDGIRSFASETIELLKQHLDLAKSVKTDTVRAER